MDVWENAAANGMPYWLNRYGYIMFKTQLRETTNGEFKDDKIRSLYPKSCDIPPERRAEIFLDKYDGVVGPRTVKNDCVDARVGWLPPVSPLSPGTAMRSDWGLGVLDNVPGSISVK